MRSSAFPLFYWVCYKRALLAKTTNIRNTQIFFHNQAAHTYTIWSAPNINQPFMYIYINMNIFATVKHTQTNWCLYIYISTPSKNIYSFYQNQSFAFAIRIQLTPIWWRNPGGSIYMSKFTWGTHFVKGDHVWVFFFLQTHIRNRTHILFAHDYSSQSRQVSRVCQWSIWNVWKRICKKKMST